MVNVLPFTKIGKKQISIKDIVFDKKVRSYCKLPYPDHPNGCPNFGKRLTCPPNSPYLENKLKFKYFYLIYAVFQFKEYKDEMKKQQPDWSEKQLGCVLYWQASVKKLLKNKINSIKETYYLLSCGAGFGEDICAMESVGINVDETMKNLGIILEFPPQKRVFLVCLLCSNKKIMIKKQKKLM